MMQRAIIVALVALVGVGTADAEPKKQVPYIGIHSIPKSSGGGLCYIEGPHVHIYAADKIQFREHRKHNYFVGDPVAYGYDGPKHSYKGHHPIHVDAVVDDDSVDPHVEFCYLDGPHYHAFAPPEGPEFAVVDGVSFYVATPPKQYVAARPAMIEINAMYRPLVYVRPVVEVEAPVGWIGARVEFATPAVVVRPAVAIPPAVVVRPGVGVGVAAGIGIGIDARVRVHVPSVNIHVGTPGVIVHEHRHHKHKKHKKHRKFR